MAAGAFGKIPAAGDFVARGLTPAQRGALDRWLTEHLAGAAQDPEAWPDWGLRAALTLPDGDAALLILPSRDRAGRLFPFAVTAPLGESGARGIDAWADDVLDLALDAVDGVIGVEELGAELAQVDAPAAAGNRVAVPALWRRGGSPAPPDAAIAALFPPAVSSG